MVLGGFNFPGVVLTWPPGENDKSRSNFALGISCVGLAPEVLALGGSNLPSGSVRTDSRAGIRQILPDVSSSPGSVAVFKTLLRNLRRQRVRVRHIYTRIFACCACYININA